MWYSPSTEETNVEQQVQDQPGLNNKGEKNQ